MDITAKTMDGKNNKNSLSFSGITQSESSLLPLLAERLDLAVEFLLAGLLGFMPFAFGAIQPWSQQVVVMVSGVMVFCLLLKQLLCRQGKIVLTWAYLPIVAFLLIAVLEIIPLPVRIISILSPETATLKTSLLFGSDADSSKLGWTTLSFYPHQSKEAIRIVLAAASVFFVVVNSYRSAEKIKRLLRAIVFIGAGVALLAIVQDVFGNGKIYFFVTTPLKANSGPFINHSHFGQFMNLSIGAAIALGLVKLLEDIGRQNNSLAEVFEYFESTAASGLWFLAAVISVSAAAMFVSLTRGGMLSMIFAIAFTVILAAMRKTFRKHGWILVVIALAALSCVLYIGFDSVYERFVTIGSLDSYQTRLQVIKDLAEPVRKFSLFGTGLGSHDVVYPMFQSVNTALQFSHAENEYIQLAEEMGLLGLAAMVGFAVIIGIHFRHGLGKKKRDINAAIYGLGFGVVAILVHSVSDFGQHLPANAILTTIFCALIVVLGKKEKDEKTELINIFKRKLSLASGLVFVIAVFGWAVVGANDARVADEYRQMANRINENIKSDQQIPGNKVSESKFIELIDYASAAVDRQPENVRYIQWLSVYRWQYASGMLDEQSGMMSDAGFDLVYEIVEDLKQARFAAPTFGPTYCLLGQLQKFVIFESAGADNIRIGLLLEPNDEVTTFAAGMLDYSEGKIEKSFEKFSKSVSLGGTFFGDMVRIYLTEPRLPQMAINLAGQNIGRLRFVHKSLVSENLEEAAEICYLRLIGAMEGAASRQMAVGRDLAELGSYYNEQKNTEKAIEYYKRALAGEYGNVRWRLKLARVYVDDGDVEEAIKQCRICVRLEPQFYQAEKFLKQLVIRPEIIKKQLGYD